MTQTEKHQEKRSTMAAIFKKARRFALALTAAVSLAGTAAAGAETVAYAFNSDKLDCYEGSHGGDRLTCAAADFRLPQAAVPSPMGDRYKLVTKRGVRRWIRSSLVVRLVNRPPGPHGPLHPNRSTWASYTRPPAGGCAQPVAEAQVASLSGFGPFKAGRAPERIGAAAGIQLAASASNCVRVRPVVDDELNERLRDVLESAVEARVDNGPQTAAEKADAHSFYVVITPAVREAQHQAVRGTSRRLTTAVTATLIKVSAASVNDQIDMEGAARDVVESFTGRATVMRRAGPLLEAKLWRMAYAQAFDALVRNLIAERDTDFEVKRATALMARPHQGGTAITQLIEGDTVTATGRTTAKWREVRDGGGLAGWVRGELLAPQPSRLAAGAR
jgi:hypothetical protein